MKLVNLLLVIVFCLGVQIVKAESIEVTVKLSPVGSYVAKTDKVEGAVIVEGGKVKASSIKVLANTLKTGIELRDKHTKERLETEKFPEITLLTGEGSGGKGTGTIKIKGIEKPISGDYKVEGTKVTAQFKLSLKDFGIEKIRYLGVGVKDEVEVKVQLPIKK